VENEGYQSSLHIVTQINQEYNNGLGKQHELGIQEQYAKVHLGRELVN